MTPESRYLIASARLAALSDPQAWTPEDLADVIALVDPPMSFARWMERRGAQVQSVPTQAPIPASDEPDMETTATVNSLIGGDLRQLVTDGIVEITEGPPA